MANCMSCGRVVASHRASCIYCGGAPDARQTSPSCPRCLTPLESITLGPIRVASCAGCAAAWYGRGALEALLIAPGSAPWMRAAQDILKVGQRRERTERDSTPGVLLPCPECGERMIRQRAARGVVVDVCFAHGVFIDLGQLEVLRQQAQAAVTALALEPARRAAIPEQARRWSTPDLIIALTAYLVWGFLLREDDAG